jgi:glycosyltransferase involved in cell wall biosynthesis
VAKEIKGRNTGSSENRKENFERRRPQQPTQPQQQQQQQPQQQQPRRVIKPQQRSAQTPYQGERQGLLISVVVPLFNEEESLPELALHLETELKKAAGDRYEVIFVDDGSTDGSFAELKKIRDRNHRFRAIRFRRNYGKSAALSVGFAEARGSIVITMDADLQDDPSEIPNLISKIKEGYDLVTGWKKRRHDPLSKTIPSKLFNYVTSKVSGIKLHDFNCGLKAYRRDVVKSLQVYGEMHRYLPALAHWDGFKVSEIPVQHHARRYGRTKFGASRFLKGFLDLLTVLFTTRYLVRPLHFFGTIGTLIALIGFATDAYLTVEWLLGRTALSNRPLALLGVALIIVGVQLVSLGLLGEMIVKNSLEKANYSIKERL